MADEKSKDKRMVPVAPIMIILSLAGLLIVVIKARSIFLPIMFRSIVIVLLVLIIIVNGYWVFGQSLITLFKRIRMARKHRALTKKYFHELDRFVDRFGELININHCDTIPYVLNHLQSDAKYANILSSPHGFKNAFDVFYAAIGKLSRTTGNFLLLVKWFESIVNLCNEHLICKPVEKIRLLGRDGVPERIREDYKRCKGIYDKFILEYMDFAKGVNKDSGQKVAREYFETPKDL